LACTRTFQCRPYHFYFITRRRPPQTTPFPYTTLFRSRPEEVSSRYASPRAFRYSSYWLSPSTVTSRMSRSTRTLRMSLKGMKLRSEEHTSELQSRFELVCRLLLDKKKRKG